MAGAMSGVDHARVRDALAAVAGRVAGLVRSSAPATRIPRSEWTVGEVAAHLATTQALGLEWMEGVPSPYGDGRLENFAPVNARLLAEFPERDAVRLADLIVARTRSFLEAGDRRPPGEPVPTHFGPMDVTTLSSYLLYHLLVHGVAVARALGRRPPLDREHVHLTMPFLRAVMPWVFDGKEARGLRACMEVRIRGGERFCFLVEAGRLTVEDHPLRRVDCHVSADPVAFFLVGAGLMSLPKGVALGKLIAWGPRPWLAFRVKRLFPNP